MAQDVIRGENVYIQINTAGGLKKFLCAENVEYHPSMTTKKVRTLNDGHWRKSRGQDVGYTVNFSGIIPYNDPSGVNALDLMNYIDQMVDLEFQINFEDPSLNLVTAIVGQGLIVEAGLTGPADFAGSDFTVEGNGKPYIGVPPTCDKSIVSYTVTKDPLGFGFFVAILTLNSGSVPRYDYTVDGYPYRTALSTGWRFNLLSIVGASNVMGPHTLEIWPVCDNGIRGTKLTHAFSYPT
jgi:hypothetical protein